MMQMNAFCRQDLLDIGLTYHARRNSEKRDLSDALFTDVSTALDRLDLANKLPEIYCEAKDLLSIPSLEVDLMMLTVLVAVTQQMFLSLYISSPPLPQPLLIKLSSVWDKCLIMASVRKLRDYTIPKLYMHEILSPEARAARASRRKALLASHSSPNQQSIQSSSNKSKSMARASPTPSDARSKSSHCSSSPSSSSGLSDGNASDSDTA